MESSVLETRCLSSLVKVFAEDQLDASTYTEGTALINERYTFQVAYKRNGSLLKGMKIRIKSDLEEYITVRKVGLVPCEFSLYYDHDDDILRTDASLFPDPLYPIDEDGLTGIPGQWRSIWITINVTKDVAPGLYPIRVIIETNKAEILGEEIFYLEVIGVELPEQKLIHTHWFHTDCIATEYNVEVFSEAYWNLVDKWIGYT